MKTFKNYHDFYLKLDVILLSDVFEKFRDQTLSDFKIDPINYVSTPSLSYDNFLLSLKNEKNELISDYDQYLFFERSKRGGYSGIHHRYAKSNNKYQNNYDKNKQNSFLKYYDVNNEYGYCMSQNMRCGNFKFKSEEEINEIN